MKLALSVVVTLSLVALSTPAWAGEAWVLWDRLEGEKSWRVVAARPTYEACEALKREREEAWALYLASRGVSRQVYVKCFPDTIDPRAKGTGMAPQSSPPAAPGEAPITGGWRNPYVGTLPFSGYTPNPGPRSCISTPVPDIGSRTGTSLYTTCY